MTDFDFASGWLRMWHEVFEPITLASTCQSHRFSIVTHCYPRADRLEAVAYLHLPRTTEYSLQETIILHFAVETKRDITVVEEGRLQRRIETYLPQCLLCPASELEGESSRLQHVYEMMNL